MADPGMRCAMSGIPIRDPGDGIWDYGEWISWEWINSEIEAQEQSVVRTDAGNVEEEQPLDFELRRSVREAMACELRTGEPSLLWGRIGERYAAERFGLQLSRNNSQGHDGRIGNDFVEIKTITPLKQKPFVRVKRAGNFSMLAVIRVRPDYRFEARIVRRDRLPKGNGGAYLVLAWSSVCALAEPV
jgi:hypothetical protein